MYTFKHFLGYGVIVPTEKVKSSPFDLTKWKEENCLIKTLNEDTNEEGYFVGYALSIFDEEFLVYMRYSEKHFPQLWKEIFKEEVPEKYKPTMIATKGDIWKEV